MNPDLAWAVWCGERQRRIEDVLASRAAGRGSASPSRLSRAMRYAVLDGGKRMRPLLAYAAGELVAAPPEVGRCRRRRGGARPRLLAHPRRSCPAWTTTRCAAASRRATSRSARRWRSSPAMRCRRSRSACSPSGRLARCAQARMRAARRRVRRARHGRRAGRRSRQRRRDAFAGRARNDASDEDRRVDPRVGAARRGVRPAARRRREPRRSMRMRPQPGSRSR